MMMTTITTTVTIITMTKTTTTIIHIFIIEKGLDRSLVFILASYTIHTIIMKTKRRQTKM